jgi:hypothetical protein
VAPPDTIRIAQTKGASERAGVSDDEVAFVASYYRETLAYWCESDAEVVRGHAATVLQRFEI